MQQGILNSLDQIRCFWHDLLDGDVEAMRKVDEPTVKALELKAPGSSTLDAQTIQRQLGGAQIFSAFSDQDRSQILERLRRFKDLIPSLHTFFRNLCYWEACMDSMRHLITPPRGDTIFTAFEKQFTGVNQQEGQVRIQVDEANFIFAPGSTADQVELGYRQIVAFAMRHFWEIPRTPEGKDVLRKPRAKADKAVLRQYAELSIRLGFQSPEIEKLMENPPVSVSDVMQPSIKPSLVTSGPGEEVPQRCGLPKLEAFEEDRDSLFLHYLDNEQNERGEGVTSFFVRRSIYFEFLGRPRSTVALNAVEREREREAIAQLERQAQTQQQHEEQEQEAQAQRREAREEQEREEQEAQAQREQEQARREREEQEQREREEQEQRERQEQEQEQRKREEQAHRERQEQTQREREEREQREHHELGQVCIRFKIRERSGWRDVQSLWVDRSDPSEVARVAKKNIRKGLRIFDTKMKLLGPDDCFEVVTADETNTILLIPQNALDINDRLLDSASVLSYEAIVDSVRQTRPRRN